MTPENVDERETYDCRTCGAKVKYDEPFSHKHCNICSDSPLYDDFKTHAAVPTVARNHALGSVVWDALSEVVRNWDQRVHRAVVADGSQADLGRLLAELGQDAASMVVVQVGAFEQEEAMRVLTRRPLDASVFGERLVALRHWLEDDPEQPKGAGWDHFGFRAAGVVAPRPAGSLVLSACPVPGRIWVRVEQQEGTKYVRSRRGAGLICPVTEAEMATLRGAVRAAGFEVAEEWGGGDGVSYVVTGPEVGPNVAAANVRGGGRYGDLVLPEGWR